VEIDITVGENLPGYFYPIHHAVVLVGCRAVVLAVGQKTVALKEEARSTLGNIGQMPVVCFVPLGSNLVSPGRTATAALPFETFS